MLKELSKKYDVIALSSPGNEISHIKEREKVRVIEIPMERHISLYKDIVSLFKLIAAFRREKPQMVHSMTPKAGLLCMIAAWLARVPVRVHTFTGLVFPTSTGVKRWILKATDRLTCACATHVIPEGEGVKSDLLNNNITKKPLKVLGYGNVKGIDLKVYSRSRVCGSQFSVDLLHKKGKAFIFLFVGRIVKDKGINELVEAFSKLNNEYPKTGLWLVGPYEDSLDPVSDEARRAIAENNGIESVGAKQGDELLAYYAAADCFVMPSYREGFPNTVIEAGAMDLPCIVTDINGSREIIIDGKNGVIVPPKDKEALYNAMKLMLQSKADLERMAGNARIMIGNRFEQNFVRKCLYDFYDEIL